MIEIQDLTKQLSTVSLLSPEARAAAATALSQFATDDLAWTQLADAESDSDPRVASAASAALDAIVARRPDLVVAICGLAYSEDTRADYPRVTRMVGRLPDGVALDVLFFIVEHVGQYRRAKILSEAASTERFPTEALVARLDTDTDDNHRRMIAQILIHRDDDRGQKLMLDEFYSTALFEALLARGEARVRRVCELLCEQDCVDPCYVQYFAERRKKVEGIVHAMARDPSAQGAILAAKVLGFWDDSRSVAQLMRIAGDPSYRRRVRDEALESLAQLEAPEAVELLAAGLLDPGVGPLTREICAEALGAIGGDEGLPALRKMAEDRTQKRLASAARHAIAEMLEPDEGEEGSTWP